MVRVFEFAVLLHVAMSCTADAAVKAKAKAKRCGGGDLLDQCRVNRRGGVPCCAHPGEARRKQGGPRWWRSGCKSMKNWWRLVLDC